jgi:hypothetical protein
MVSSSPVLLHAKLRGSGLPPLADRLTPPDYGGIFDGGTTNGDRLLSPPHLAIGCQPSNMHVNAAPTDRVRQRSTSRRLCLVFPALQGA